MEAVRRSQRVGRSKLGNDASVESTPAIEQKWTGRLSSARKALVDVTNTCSITSYGSKKEGDLNEMGNQSILKPTIDPELPSNAKTGRRVTGNRAITSLSLKVSKNISAVAPAKDSKVKATRVRKIKEQAGVVSSKVESTPILNEVAKTAAVVATPKESAARGRKAKEPAPAVGCKVLPIAISDDVFDISSAVGTKDPVVKVVRGRKAKEQAQSESNSGITHVSDRTTIVSQAISTAKLKASGPKSRRKVAQVESPIVIVGDTGASKEKVMSNHNSLEQEKRLKTSRSSRGSAETSSGLGEAHSELEMTLVRPKRAIRSKKYVEDVTSPEFSSGKNAKLPLAREKGIGNSVSVDTAAGRRALPSSVMGVQGRDNAVVSGGSDCVIVSIKMPKLSKESSSDVDRGTVTPSCHIQLGRRKKDQIATPKSVQEQMKGSEDKYSQRKALKGAHLQASGEKKPLHKQRIHKGTGTQTNKMAEKGSSTEVFCSSAFNQKKSTGGQRSSGYGQSTEILLSEALKTAPAQQTGRRNLARGARKPINYAEDDNFGSTKIPTVLPGTSMTHIDPSSAIVGARTVQQTTRRGRKKIAGATIVPTPSCIEMPLFDSSKNAVDGVIEIPSTIASSLEQEYERFKMEKLACEIAAKKPLPAAITVSVEPTLTQSADLVTKEEPFLSTSQTLDVARRLINLEEAAQSPARKFIRATRSPKVNLLASPELHTGQVPEQVVHVAIEPVVHVTEPSVSGEPGAGLSSQTTPVQRGQKRGRKENNVLSTQPERLTIDADVDARPSYSSPPHDEIPIPASDDLVKNTREFNGAHEHVEQVDAENEDGLPKDDPDRAVFEHEDQVCVDVSGKECNDPLFKPFASFGDADILKKLKDCCKSLGKPSPLQAHALPFLLAGRDLVAISESHAGESAKSLILVS